ncbi:MAG: ABC transporter substrate-binding protein [Clostridia bacterium]|nr:ABC transporter substrate-binding protein [Clostridia bacterium]
MKLKKFLSLVLVVAMIFALTACKDEASNAGSGESTDLRHETLYVTGLWWGPPNNFNHLTGWSAFPCNMNSNHLLYETLFMYNNITEALEPLLGTEYAWVDDYTVEVKLNEKAKFSDGEKVMADDVVYTFELGDKYPTAVWSGIWEEIESIEAVDDYTVRIVANKERNIHIAIEEALAKTPIHPKHVWEVIEKDNDYDLGKITEFFNEDPIGSGPYKVYSYDDTKITVIRDDNYWGQELFGGLPAPKYITHLDFASNDVATVEFEKGVLDYSENYMPNVWEMKGFGDTIKTYLPDAPYYTNDTAPTIYLNVQKDGLNNAEVRRALAYSIDYGKIAETAMSGYSIPVEAGLYVNTEASRATVDMDQLKDLQWTYDVDKANAILDSIGAVRGEDGVRVLDGTRLGPWKVTCPGGWTEWNIALEVVAQSAKAVGIELVTDFPDWSPYFNDMTTGEFDIIMNTPAAFITPANPWKAYSEVMSSVGVPPVGEAAYWNYGRYHNDRANELVELVPHASSEAELKAYYTELNQIYLQDVPAIPLMYRPVYYYTVNESVWTGFPQEQDHLPPFFFDGAGIRGLYNLKHK